MLRRVHLIDFKSFVDEEVELAPLTLLVGANASGKSNFLDALWFLHGLTLGLPLDEVLDGEERARRNGEPWPELRGGSKEASRLGTTGFELRSVWEGLGTDPRDKLTVRHEISCQTRPVPRVIREACGTADPLPQIAADAPKSALAGDWEPDDAATEHIVLALFDFHLLTIRPDRMRGYGQIQRPQLAADGANFSGALHHLCAEPEERRNVVDWLTELLACEIVDVDFVEVEELGDVMTMFVEKGGKRVSARSLSDGTLRFLGVLLSLRNASPGSTFLIEEVDSGLHPARIHVLMQFLRQISRERNLQIIATTHAPSCLESLDGEDLRSAIVFGRVPDHPGTIMRRLGDLPHFDEVVERSGIGELFSTGWLEMAL